jgi:alginate O-acetyltransferase complex protein AlgJ
MTLDSNVSAKSSWAAAAPAFALPVLFLGYAVVANYEFVTGLGRDIAEMPKSASEYLNGEAAIQIDTYYKKIMPHRLPSIDVMGAARYLAFREGRPGAVVGDDGWLFSKEEFEATLKRTPDLAEAARGVVEIRDFLAAKGIELVVVPLPAKADIYREHVSYPAIPTDLERLYEDFRTVLDNAGIRNIETRAPLEAAKAKGPLFLTTDTHWTPLGAEVVADAVGAALGQRDTPYTITDAAPVEREGDLSKFIVTGGLAPLVGLGPETVVPREASAPPAASSTDIFGPSSIPFVLTGTSYSANPQWSFGESLKVSLGADVLNLAEEGKGPVAPMRAFLESETLRDTPPEVVIWEFPVRYLGQTKLWDAAPAKEATE